MGVHGADARRAQPTAPSGVPGDPHPKRAAVAGRWGQEAQHLRWGSASLAAGADETLCQGSSSAGGDSEGQPGKVLAPLQAQPRAQLHATQGTAQPPGHSLPTLLPGDGGLTTH